MPTTRLVRRPDSWLTIKITEDTVEQDFKDLYSEQYPDGTATIVVFKFGDPARFLVDVMDPIYGSMMSQFGVDDVVFFAGNNAVKLSNDHEYVGYDEIYQPLPEPLSAPLPTPDDPSAIESNPTAPPT